MIELVLNVLLVLTSALLVVLILLHRGKGGGLSSMFGGAVSSSLSGSSVVEKNLNRLTVFTALIWTRLHRRPGDPAQGLTTATRANRRESARNRDRRSPVQALDCAARP